MLDLFDSVVSFWVACFPPDSSGCPFAFFYCLLISTPGEDYWTRSLGHFGGLVCGLATARAVLAVFFAKAPGPCFGPRSPRSTPRPPVRSASPMESTLGKNVTRLDERHHLVATKQASFVPFQLER